MHPHEHTCAHACACTCIGAHACSWVHACVHVTCCCDWAWDWERHEDCQAEGLKVLMSLSISSSRTQQRPKICVLMTKRKRRVISMQILGFCCLVAIWFEPEPTAGSSGRRPKDPAGAQVQIKERSERAQALGLKGKRKRIPFKPKA